MNGKSETPLEDRVIKSVCLKERVGDPQEGDGKSRTREWDEDGEAAVISICDLVVHQYRQQSELVQHRDVAFTSCRYQTTAAQQESLL